MVEGACVVYFGLLNGKGLKRYRLTLKTFRKKKNNDIRHRIIILFNTKGLEEINRFGDVRMYLSGIIIAPPINNQV
jgi:hypothetical protein